MTSKERHEVRYLRRKAKRLEKRREVARLCDDFNTVFSFEHLYKGYRLSCRGVGWKASTQKYKANALLNVVTTMQKLQAGTYKSSGFYEFDIVERGKQRHIKSVHISERVVQRTLCDYSLIPLLTRTFIYDNGACMRDKGIDFAINRLLVHLRRHYANYGTEGYALVFDFSSYFDNIDHDVLKGILARTYSDTRILALVYDFIDNFGDKGLGLGSQISQVSALAYPNRLDHFIKENLRIKGYGRYMDDGYLIHPSKEYLQGCRTAIAELCEQLGIKLNKNKTQTVKLSQGLPFLKTRFILTASGKIIRKPKRKGITVMRRKLKTFKVRLDSGKMSREDIRCSYTSWRGYMSHKNAYRTVQSMDALYNKLFNRRTEK